MLVGLTGGIGSGKTAAANYFAKLGIDVVDADVASRAVVETGKPALAKIREHFGQDILLSDSTLDRAKLRSIVFADSSERGWLQRLLHPLINHHLQAQKKCTEKKSQLMLLDQRELMNFLEGVLFLYKSYQIENWMKNHESLL